MNQVAIECRWNVAYRSVVSLLSISGGGVSGVGEQEIEPMTTADIETGFEATLASK